MWKLSRILVCGAVVVSVAIPSQAQIQLSGLLRDEYALGLTPTIKSAGMGGAYVGIDDIRSMNPAALSGVDFYDAALTYGNYDHDDGPMAHRGRLDMTLPVPYIGGGARLMIDWLDSESEEMTQLGAPVEYDGFTLGFQQGLNITESWAVGIGGYPYEKAEVDMVTPGGTLEGEALSQLGSVQLGTLYRLHEKVNVGGQFIYIYDDLELSMPGGGHMGDYYNIHYFSIGASVMPFEGTLLAVDYWNGEIEGDVVAGVPFDVDVDRWNFGAEQRVCDYFDLRAGSNNGGFTAGFSIHIAEGIDLDYAYVNQALRDKESVFGDTEYHGVSLNYRF